MWLSKFFKKKAKKTPTNKVGMLTLEDRVNIAKNIQEIAKSYKIQDLSINSDQISGNFRGAGIESGGEEIPTEIHWRVDPFGDLQMAAVVPTKMSDSHKYLSKFIDYEKVDQKNREDIIILCRQIAKYEGVVSTALDVLTGLIPMSGWNITNVENPEAKKLCEVWCEKMNGFLQSEISVKGTPGIENWVQSSHRTMLRDGDYVGLKKWDAVDIVELGKSFNLPVEIEGFDILNLEWPKDLMAIKKRYFLAQLPDRVVKVAKDGPKLDDEVDKIIDDTLSKELKQQIIEQSGKVPLPSPFVLHLSRRSDGGDWGEPYIVKTYGALAYKNRIRMLDNATIAGLVQRIWIIKLGTEAVDDEEFHVPDPDRLSLAVSTFRQLKTQNILIWPGPDLQKEELTTSDANVLSFDSRYTEADDDVYRALGVPRLLIEGKSSGSVSRDTATFLSLISMLKNTLVVYEREVTGILREIMEENGFEKEFPKFKFHELSISDIEGYRSASLRLYEQALIGRKQSLRDHGYNPDDVIKEQEKEVSENLNDKVPLPLVMINPGAGRPVDIKDGDGKGKDNQPPKDTKKTKNQRNM
jgi:hypothetical protein